MLKPLIGGDRDVCIYNVKRTQRRCVDHSCISRVYLRVSARKNTPFYVCVLYRVRTKSNHFHSMTVSIVSDRSIRFNVRTPVSFNFPRAPIYRQRRSEQCLNEQPRSPMEQIYLQAF